MPFSKNKTAVLALTLIAVGLKPVLTNESSHVCVPVTAGQRVPSRTPHTRYEDPDPRNSSHVAADPGAIRCSFDTLAARQRCGKLSFSTPTAGHLYFDPASGHYSYEPDACLLRRLPGPEARACLARVGPILFIGDSVTRYQFLTLAHFLTAGVYQHPFDGLGSLSDVNNQDSELPGGKFDKLWLNAERQVRAHDPGGSVLHVNHSRSKHWEQAHLQLNVTRGVADRASPQEAAKLRGRTHAHVYYYNMNTAGPKIVRRTLDWALEQRRDYSHVIINVCAHYHGAYNGNGGAAKPAAEPQPTLAPPAAPSGWAAALVSDVTQSLAMAAERLPRSVRLVWKTCTTPIEEHRNGTDGAEAEIASYCRRSGVAVYDVRSISMAAVDQRLVTTWKYGSVHFLQFMYEQFNDLLLNTLCR